MANVTVLGAGMMGTALCTPIADAGHSVRLVGTHGRRVKVETNNDRSMVTQIIGITHLEGADLSGQ